LPATGATKVTDDTRTWNALGIATLGVPFHGNALSVTVLKTVGTKWNLAFYSL
jgi:hypothetical protein